MKSIPFRLACLAICLCLFCYLPCFPVSATQATAQDLRASTTISGSGYSSFGFLLDNNITKYQTSTGNTTIELENAAGMGSLYLLFNLEYGSYTITDNTTGQVITAGEYGFLHEYVDLQEHFGYLPTSVTLSFQNGAVRLSEIYVFSQGEAPDYVQIWEAPVEGGADLLLLATHGDDDQLFLAGLLPLYAGQLDLRVQVVYLTDHRNLTNARTHEMLNGLWAVGVEAYPVFGDFDDFRIDSLKDTYKEYARLGTSKEELLDFVVSNIRRFRPQVIVGHDINGEYGHGMHMVYTDLLIQALELTNDPAASPASAQAYGLWDVPKTYLHLYEENSIVLDYDQPLEYFDGLTAFQATQKLGYPCHKSQQYTWFTRWINGNNGEITKATQIATYNPCRFGLYRSTVGPDVAKNDFLENIIPYAQQEQMDRDAAQAVTDLIAELGEITLASGDAIEQARSAFAQVTSAQHALVTNLDTITAAEATYAALVQAKAEKDAADLAAAQAVMALIDALPSNPENDIALSQAKNAYDQLTPEQQALVTNAARLEALTQQLQQWQEQQRLEQERLEQERQAQQQQELERQQKELQQLCLLLALLFLLFIVTLATLRHKKKKYRKNRKKF